jgi:hypothetical protein
MASAVGVDEKVADALLKEGVDASIDNCTFAMDGTGNITVASAHGLSANEEVRFSTTDTLPTELDVNTRYYVLSAGLTATKLRVSATVGGTAITYSTAGMGTHTIWKHNKYFLLHSTQKDPGTDQRVWSKNKSAAPCPFTLPLDGNNAGARPAARGIAPADHGGFRC